MTLSLAVMLTTFGVVFLLELPDKTMVATMVLSARYRPAPVLLGVALAFAGQMSLAVAVGHALTLLPRALTLSIAATLFGVGAVILIRESFSDEDEETRSTRTATSFWSIVALSAGVLFLAEFGDGSQIAAAGLAAHYSEPLSVFLGAWAAEISVCTLAVFAGRGLLRVLPLHGIQRIAAGVFTVFAVIAVAGVVQAL